jgi:hypothetical protein
MQNNRKTKAREGEASPNVGALEGGLVRVIHRHELEIPEEIEATRRRIAEARTRLATIEERAEERRTARQQLLAEGADTTKINHEIEAIRAERELAEDLMVGLEMKIQNLEQEGLRIVQEERPRLERELALVKVQPLIEAYNATAARLAEITEAICRLMMEYRQPFGKYATGMIAAPSSWEGFELVPRLSLYGTEHEHFFFHPWWADRTQRERVAGAREQQATASGALEPSEAAAG